MEATRAVRDVHRCRVRILKRRKRKEEGIDVSKRNQMLLEKIHQLLSGSGRSQASLGLGDRVKSLRRVIVVQGAPDEEQDTGPYKCSTRGVIWKILLGALHMDAMLYIRLVEQGPSLSNEYIKNDTFRVYPHDEDFCTKVPECKMARLLNAYVRYNHELGMQTASSTRDDESTSSEAEEGQSLGYVQAMSILSGVLAYVLPEPDAFFALNALLTKHMPRYVTQTLDGVHDGCKLVDKCLAVLDPPLYMYLKAKCLNGVIYAFPYVMSLYACVQPLSEVVRLWDVQFSFGIHLTVLLVVAQCILMRDALFSDPNPMKILLPRNHPPFDAEIHVACALSLIPHLPQEMYDTLAGHPFVET